MICRWMIAREREFTHFSKGHTHLMNGQKGTDEIGKTDR